MSLRSWFLGSKHTGGRMTTLTAGVQAPPFTLSAMDGKNVSLQDALSRGPVALAFFKVSCPICQYAFPLYERLFQTYKNQGVTLVGVSQNTKKDTDSFNKKLGITFPVLLDDMKTYPVSNAYGLRTVPTLFWIAQDSTVEISSVGWNKKDFEAVSQKMADAAKIPPALLLRPEEKIADFRFG